MIESFIQAMRSAGLHHLLPRKAFLFVISGISVLMLSLIGQP